MSDPDREWTIEHAGEQLYDIISLLDYDETSVKMWGPTAIDPTTVEQEEWRETFETVEAGERIRAALTPRLTGTPASFRLQISCTDTSDERHSEWSSLPQPGRTRSDLRFPGSGRARHAADAPEAHRILAARENVGKVVLVP